MAWGCSCPFDLLQANADSEVWGHGGYESEMGASSVRVKTTMGGASPSASAAPAEPAAAGAPFSLRATPKEFRVEIVNLAPDADEATFRDFASSLGTVISLNLDRNEAGQCLGSAAIVFEELKAAQEIVSKLDNTVVDGRKLFARMTTPVDTPAPAPAAVAMSVAPLTAHDMVAATTAAFDEVDETDVRRAAATRATAHRERDALGGYQRSGGYERGSGRRGDDVDERRGRGVGGRGERGVGDRRGDDRRGGADRGAVRRTARDEDRAGGRIKGRKGGKEDVDAEFDKYMSKGAAKEGNSATGAGRKASQGKEKRKNIVDSSVDAEFEAYVSKKNAAKPSDSGDAAAAGTAAE